MSLERKKNIRLLLIKPGRKQFQTMKYKVTPQTMELSATGPLDLRILCETTIQCKMSWDSSYYGCNFTYLRHNTPCVFRTPLPHAMFSKKTYRSSQDTTITRLQHCIRGRRENNRTNAFFPDFLVWCANFEEKYLMSSNYFALDYSWHHKGSSQEINWQNFPYWRETWNLSNRSRECF